MIIERFYIKHLTKNYIFKYYMKLVYRLIFCYNILFNIDHSYIFLL